jgi:hypothetical protein
MPPRRIRTHDRSRQEDVDLRLRPRGHWDRQTTSFLAVIFTVINACGDKYKLIVLTVEYKGNEHVRLACSMFDALSPAYQSSTKLAYDQGKYSKE